MSEANNEVFQPIRPDLRDYFAAMAMQGLLSSDVTAPRQQFAQEAYAMADEMLKAREAKHGYHTAEVD